LDPDKDAKPLNRRRQDLSAELAFLHDLVEQLALNIWGALTRKF
jgi:hypothetical protein